MSERADTILKGARVYTRDDDQPRASVVATMDKEIVFVGEVGDGSWPDLVGSETNVVDLGGRTSSPDSSTATRTPSSSP